MQKKIIAIGCTSILLLLATYIRWQFYPQPSLNVQYYYSIFILIAIFLIIILSTVVLWQWGNEKKAGLPINSRLYKKNRRNYYRIQYTLGAEPKLQVEKCNNNSNRPYLLEIVNLSEKGSQIHHNGLIKMEDKIDGHIIFTGGERVKISGKIIHTSGSTASMQFDYSLPTELLINEQRHLLSLKAKYILKRKI